MYLITGLGQRNKPYVLGDYHSGVGQRELIGWPEGLHGFGEPSEVINTMSSDIIGFAFDKADLGPAQLAEIDLWARSILAQETHKVRRVQLIGHTDPVGSPQYNKTLGQRRADIVRQALITALESKRPGSSKAIAITTDSAGELRPYPGFPPSAQRRVHVTAFMDPPPPPSSSSRQWVPPPGYREPPRMGPAEPGAKYRGAITGAQILEERFLKAERSDDIQGMAEAAEAYYTLLGQFPPQGPGMSRTSVEIPPVIASGSKIRTAKVVGRSTEYRHVRVDA